MLSPALAMPVRKLLIRPPGTLRIRKLTSPSRCNELNEYARVCSLPGMPRFTYCPGRNASLLRDSPLIDSAIVLSDSWRTALMVAS
ncbi:hypothetical protein D3C87_1539660 [compost metagenome]